MGGLAGVVGPDADKARDLLRQVAFPGLSRDIVSFGFVRDIVVEGDAVVVHFAPNTKNSEKVKVMERGIFAVLREAGFSAIDVQTEPPFDEAAMLLRGGGTINPLQAEMREAGLGVPPDLLLEELERTGTNPGPDLQAPDANPGDRPCGPDDPVYTGVLPVFQWDIDPSDPAAAGGETTVHLDGSPFRVWWQVHPRGDLVYVSLQATRDDWVGHAGKARPHSVGRAEAVNLVYDTDRQGVLAIYGTARDFRPFVEAFRRAYMAQTGEHPGPGIGGDRR